MEDEIHSFKIFQGFFYHVQICTCEKIQINKFILELGHFIINI
jgi:hypothetical protein